MQQTKRWCRKPFLGCPSARSAILVCLLCMGLSLAAGCGRIVRTDAELSALEKKVRREPGKRVAPPTAPVTAAESPTPGAPAPASAQQPLPSATTPAPGAPTETHVTTAPTYDVVAALQDLMQTLDKLSVAATIDSLTAGRQLTECSSALAYIQAHIPGVILLTGAQRLSSLLDRNEISKARGELERLGRELEQVAVADASVAIWRSALDDARQKLATTLPYQAVDSLRSAADSLHGFQIAQAFDDVRQRLITARAALQQGKSSVAEDEIEAAKAKLQPVTQLLVPAGESARPGASAPTQQLQPPSLVQPTPALQAPSQPGAKPSPGKMKKPSKAPKGETPSKRGER